MPHYRLSNFTAAPARSFLSVRNLNVVRVIIIHNPKLSWCNHDEISYRSVHIAAMVILGYWVSDPVSHSRRHRNVALRPSSNHCWRVSIHMEGSALEHKICILVEQISGRCCLWCLICLLACVTHPCPWLQVMLATLYGKLYCISSCDTILSLN
jgi:hypothetical protein